LRTGSYEVTPPDPTAPYEQSTAAGPQPTGPLNDTRRVSLCASQTPGQPPEGIFTVCATPTTGSGSQPDRRPNRRAFAMAYAQSRPAQAPAWSRHGHCRSIADGPKTLYRSQLEPVAPILRNNVLSRLTAVRQLRFLLRAAQLPRWASRGTGAATFRHVPRALDTRIPRGRVSVRIGRVVLQLI